MIEEQIGGYRIHPVAALFPLLKGEEYEKFKASIKENGQLEPILTQGELLIDGRNRLRACLDLEITPKFREFGGGSLAAIGKQILALNIERRHIEAGLRAVLALQAQEWILKQEARAGLIEGGKKGGKAAGRGRPKIGLLTDVSRPIEEPHAKNQRSTAGKLAELAHVSRRTSESAIRLHNRGSEKLKAQVVAGEILLKEAVKHLPPPKKKSAPKVPRRGRHLKESEIQFLERIRALAFDPLKEAELLGKRPWNIEISSKVALATGLKRILEEIEVRLASVRTGQNRNSGHFTNKDELTLNQPVTGSESVN